MLSMLLGVPLQIHLDCSLQRPPALMDSQRVARAPVPVAPAVLPHGQTSGSKESREEVRMPLSFDRHSPINMNICQCFTSVDYGLYLCRHDAKSGTTIPVFID